METVDRRSFLQSLGASVPAMAVIALPESDWKHKYKIGDKLILKFNRNRSYTIQSLVAEKGSDYLLLSYYLEPEYNSYNFKIEESSLEKNYEKIS